MPEKKTEPAAESCCAFGFNHSQLPTAANYYFRNLGVRDGLSQSTVYAILQDSKGFMWFGTKGGLCRYDGVSIREFKREKQNPYCLGNNYL